MDAQSGLKQLEEDVTRLEEQLDRESNLARLAARRSAAISVSMCVVVLVFVAVNVVNFRSEFTGEKLSRSLEREMRELSPLAIRELGTLAKEVLPVYAGATRSQLAGMRPEIFERFKTEIDQLSNDLLSDVDGQLAEAQERVLEATELALFESYPSLHEGTNREELSRRFQGMTETAVATAVGDFHRRFGDQVETVRKSLMKFDLADSGESSTDLQKKFIHLWLQLLDQEIMEL